LSQTYVALDLETTGLDFDNDSIIEIGAIRFTLDGVADQFTTLVNPRQPLLPVVKRLTGITDEDLATAPPIEVVASDLERFLAGSILVGHNLCGFDVPVLDAHRIRRPVAIYDTQQLAEILVPMSGYFGLADLMASFEIEFHGHHRAIADAEASRLLFLALLERAVAMPADTLSQIGQWLTPTQFPWRGFFRTAWDLRSGERAGDRPRTRAPNGKQPTPVRAPRNDRVAVPADESLACLSAAAGRADVFESFEQRPQQAQMLSAVNDCLNAQGHLMVEAGTGTGKSLAYLIPAAAQAVANGGRVVVSTSTINLQEQLAKKDIPAVQQLMGEGAFVACQLKGRRNYLCLRRFHALSGSVLTDEEAKMASRILVWLDESATGDRGEIRVAPEEEFLWSKLSADKAECSSDNSPFVVDGSCYLLKARKQGEASHVVVANHSLLLADAAIGGGVIPAYHYLVVDEAHHLEDEASRQFGFSCRQKEAEELADRCSSLARKVLKESGGSAFGGQLKLTAGALRDAEEPVREHLRTFYGLLASFLSDEVGGEESRLHVKRSTRAQARWSDIEVAWANAAAALGVVAGALQRLVEGLGEDRESGGPNAELLLSEAITCLDDTVGISRGIGVAIEADDPLRITWIETERSDGGVTISWVPLDVSQRLRDSVYLEGRGVIFTGATLQSGGQFTYLQQRLGVDECETLALGSPFDFGKQASLIVAADMPEPNAPNHIDMVAQAVHDLGRATDGRALVLFTSNAALRTVHRLVSEDLRQAGITVLGQGIDGSARQLVKALQSDPKTVLLGTASFWEGVDIPGEHLSLLVITRLPFPVPTDPVHAARSEQYEDAFSQYTLPQAAIRFKQGFGRLIRSRSDRGVVVVLDPRIVTRQYGETFLQSLSGCPVQSVPLRQVAPLTESFLAGAPAAS